MPKKINRGQINAWKNAQHHEFLGKMAIKSKSYNHTLILRPKILKDQLYQALAMLYRNCNSHTQLAERQKGTNALDQRWADVKMLNIYLHK